MSADLGQARWQAIWQSRGPWACALWPISLVYGALTGVRRWLYAARWLKTVRLPVPVVMVGNVVIGGAGKTPTVLALLDHFKKRGWRPGVVSRGYGRQGSMPLEVFLTTASTQSGDEPALIKRHSGVPVFVASKRAEAGRALLAAHPEVNLILCDDGLQHLALDRDLAIAVFDDRGIGNGWLLPAGLLREAWPPRPSSALAPDMVLQHHTRVDAMPSLANLPTFQARRRLAAEAINGLGQRMSLKELARQRPTAFAGIARPGAFFAMLRDEGLDPKHTVALPDHAAASDYVAVLQSEAGALVCTEKDAVKLFDSVPDADRIWSVPLTLQVDPSFFAAVDDHLSKLAIASRSH